MRTTRNARSESKSYQKTTTSPYIGRISRDQMESRDRCRRLDRIMYKNPKLVKSAFSTKASTSQSENFEFSKSGFLGGKAMRKVFSWRIRPQIAFSWTRIFGCRASYGRLARGREEEKWNRSWSCLPCAGRFWFGFCCCDVWSAATAATCAACLHKLFTGFKSTS